MLNERMEHAWMNKEKRDAEMEEQGARMLEDEQQETQQEEQRADKKIAVIVACQGEALPSEFLMSLRLMEQPAGFTMELVEVEGRAGLAAAYGQAMEARRFGSRWHRGHEDPVA